MQGKATKLPIYDSTDMLAEGSNVCIEHVINIVKHVETTFMFHDYSYEFSLTLGVSCLMPPSECPFQNLSHHCT